MLLACAYRSCLAAGEEAGLCRLAACTGLLPEKQLAEDAACVKLCDERTMIVRENAFIERKQQEHHEAKHGFDGRWSCPDNPGGMWRGGFITARTDRRALHRGTPLLL